MRTSAIVTALVLALTACKSDPPAQKLEQVPAADAADILEATPWLDSAPRDERDVINAFVFQDGDGLYFHGNSYKATIEALRYELGDRSIQIKFLDENKTYKTRFKIERYRGEIFDYKLTLDKSPRGPKVYYGFDAGRTLPAEVSKIKALAGTP